MAIKATEISDLIKQRIENFKGVTEARNVGSIMSVTDGITRIHGLADARYGEMLEFPGNTFGLALNLHDDVPAPIERLPATLVLRSWGAQMRSAVSEVGKSPRLAWMVGYSAVVFALLRATEYIYQPYLDDRGFGPVAIGGLFAASYVVASVVAYRTYKLRRRLGDELLLWSLLAVLGGYLVHRWLEGQRGNRIQHLVERVLLFAIVIATIWLAETVVGAATIIVLENTVSAYTERWPTALGLCFILVMIFAPEGIVGTLHRILGAKRMVDVSQREGTDHGPKAVS